MIRQIIARLLSRFISKEYKDDVVVLVYIPHIIRGLMYLIGYKKISFMTMNDRRQTK